jgi:Gas vesicle protein G
MILVDRLLLGGIGFVLDKIAAAVDTELNDEQRLREELLTAEMQNELGELSDEEFGELQAELLARLRAIRERQRGEREGSIAGVAGVEVSFDSGPREGE